MPVIHKTRPSVSGLARFDRQVCAWGRGPLVEDLDMERWKPVVGFEGSYEVSDRGRVRSWRGPRGRRLIPKILTGHSHLGYRKVCLSSGGKIRSTPPVHRLVLFAFVGLPPKGMECGHRNGARHDNRLKNIRWVTNQENIEDKRRHGRIGFSTGEDHPKSKLKLRQVKHILKAKTSSSALAERYGVCYHTIHRIRKRQLWTYDV